MTLFCGCDVTNKLQSIEDYESYYLKTRWYWSKKKATPSELKGFKVERNKGVQAFLTSPSGTFMIYTEFESSNHMKSFHGNGKLKMLPNVTESIFERDCNYTQRDPKKLLLIGFVNGRIFQVEASHSKTNRSEVMNEAISVARKMYQQLLKQQKE